MPCIERVRILIYRLVLNRCLNVGTVAYLLPLKPYLDYYIPIPANLELYYNSIYLTFLPIRAGRELLPIYYYQDLSIHSRTIQLNR